MIRDRIDGLGGRKFVLSLGCAVMCTTLLVTSYISQEIFRDLIIATVAVYIAGNTFQKVKGQPNDD